MTGKTWAVARKEITDTLRDGRTIFAVFIFPFVLYPAMLLFMAFLESKNEEAAAALHLRVAVVGEAALPEARAFLTEVPGVEAVALDAEPEDWDRAGVNAVLVVPANVHEALARGDSARVALRYKDADHVSSEAAQRLRPALERIRESLTLSWARSLGAKAGAPPALAVEREDISSETEKGLYFAALLIPYLLIFMVTAGMLQTAVDVTTGEKERSTLETVLATAAMRSEIVLGKVFAVLAAALTGAVTGIFGLWFTFAVVAKAMPAMESNVLQLSIGPGKLVWIFLTILPAAVFLAAVLIAIGCFARSVREGQTYATYVYMAAVFLGLGSFGQQSPPLERFYIPILNTALLQREILTDTVVPLHALVAISVSVALAGVMLVVAIRLFSNESVLFRT